MTYLDRKSLLAPAGLCMRAGCGAQCQDDHLLCERCAVDHRKRNKISTRQRRMFRRLQLGLWR
jgi:hypothetical protein